MSEVEFHLNDDDIPPEALKDCFRPPQVSTLVHCIHCDEEYDSWRMIYRVRVSRDGKVHGFWECGMPGCNGAGFMFDIFPVDPNYVAEDGAIEGEWVDLGDDHEDDCECAECAAFRAEMEEWERTHPMPELPPVGASAQALTEGKPNASDEAAARDRQRIEEAMASLGVPTSIPLDDLLPEAGDAADDAALVLTPDTMEQIEERLGLGRRSAAGSIPQPEPYEPPPLPANWRELLARQDEPGAAGGDDYIPF